METELKVNKIHLDNLRMACSYNKCSITHVVKSEDEEDWIGAETYKVTIEHKNMQQLFDLGYFIGTHSSQRKRLPSFEEWKNFFEEKLSHFNLSEKELLLRYTIWEAGFNYAKL